MTLRILISTITAGVVLVIAGCAPDPPPNLPYSWGNIRPIDDNYGESWLSLETDGTGQFNRIPLRPDMDCNAGEYQYLTGSVTWTMASEGWVEVNYKNRVIPALPDTALFMSLDWDKVSIATCTNDDGEPDGWIFYG